MNAFLAGKRCRWLAVFGGLLVLGVLAARQVDAKGPPARYDFTIEIGDYTPTVATGAVDEVYGWRNQGSWGDENDMRWRLVRFYHILSDDYYFDVVLPLFPEHGVTYDIDLIAGPNGYLSHGTLYEGVWAVGTCTGRTQEKWESWIDPYTGKKLKGYYTVRTWKLEGFVIQ